MITGKRFYNMFITFNAVILAVILRRHDKNAVTRLRIDGIRRSILLIHKIVLHFYY